MSTEILNELPYGVVICQENGNMLYVNQAASTILNCPNGKLHNYNILTFIDPGFVSHLKSIISSPENAYNAFQKNYAFIRLNGVNSKVFKIVYKRYKTDILLMIYDYTEFKIDRDNLSDTFLQMNISISRSNLVLKTMSSICKDVFYKDRSNLQEIVELLAKTFNLYKAAICFRNGTGHIVYSKLEKDGSYKSGTIEGDKVRSNCFIWEKEDEYINDKELFFQTPCHQCCCTNELDNGNLKNRTLNILKLKLNTDRVIGFFEFVEGDSHKLSGTELEVLEGLSQILAYIINNKEQVEDVTKYIQQRFSNLVPHK